MNSGVSAWHSSLVPATIGALARILTNREEEPKRREEFFFLCLYVFLSTVELCHVVMVKSSAIKKSRRKSQREAARLQRLDDINTGDRSPIRCAPRRMSPQKMKKEEDCVTEMLTGGQIEASDSPWSSPVVLVTKKDSWMMRLLRMPTPFRGSMTPWICWRESSGFRPWIWPAATGRSHCLRRPELRQRLRHIPGCSSSELCRLVCAMLLRPSSDWWIEYSRVSGGIAAWSTLMISFLSAGLLVLRCRIWRWYSRDCARMACSWSRVSAICLERRCPSWAILWADEGWSVTRKR